MQRNAFAVELRTLSWRRALSGLVLGTGLLLAACGSNPVAPSAPPPVASDESMSLEALVKKATSERGAIKSSRKSRGQDPVLAAGSAVAIKVFGKPELDTNTRVSEAGTVTLPLAGKVKLAGLTPEQAEERVESAYVRQRYLVDPNVSVTLSEQVSVLGAVKAPGRYSMQSRTTLLDALALAGGIADDGSAEVVLLRHEKDGSISQKRFNLKSLDRDSTSLIELTLRDGDSVLVPVAGQFSIYGEVHAPNIYRLESGMTVVDAIARGGGLTPRGSRNRIEITRRGSDGFVHTLDAELTSLVMPNDVIRVKQRLF